MLQFFEAHIIKLTAYLSLERGELKEGLRSAKNLGFRWFYGFTQCKAREKDLRGFKKFLHESHRVLYHLHRCSTLLCVEMSKDLHNKTFL